MPIFPLQKRRDMPKVVSKNYIEKSHLYQKQIELQSAGTEIKMN